MKSRGKGQTLRILEEFSASLTHEIFHLSDCLGAAFFFPRSLTSRGMELEAKRFCIGGIGMRLCV